MNKEKYRGFNYFISLAGFVLPNIAFTIIPSTNSIDHSISIIGKIFISLIYMIPTILCILAIKDLKKSNYKKSEFRISDFKGLKSEYIKVIFSFIVGVYFLLQGFYYLGIPIILISLDLLVITVLNIRYCNKLIFCPWDNENKVSLDKLNKYNKLNGIGGRIIESILLGIPVCILMSMPLIYFKVIGVNFTTFITFAGSLSVYFIYTKAFKQILDCKYNTFVEYKGKCVNFEQGGKGAGGHHTIEILNTDNKLVYITSSKPIFRNGQVITLIIGMRSNQVINY